VSENPGQGPRGSHSFDELARAMAEGSLSRRRALKFFAAAVVGALVPSRALAQQDCLPPKREICHRPPGNPSNEQTLCVGPNAARMHFANHPDDTEGACPPSPPSPPPPSPPPPSPPPPSPPPPSPPPPSPPPPCQRRGERCGKNRPDCCGNLVCRGEPGHKHCRRRRRDDDDCRRRGERCGGDRPDCCGNLVCRGEPGHKHCRRRRRDDD
jgi:hypothetical protein